MIVIGNGFAGAENQCIGLVRALGLSNRQSLYVSFSSAQSIFTPSTGVFYSVESRLIFGFLENITVILFLACDEAKRGH